MLFLDSLNFIILLKKSSGTTVSGFNKQMYFPLAFLTPKLFAVEKPKLILFFISIDQLLDLFERTFVSTYV